MDSKFVISLAVGLAIQAAAAVWPGRIHRAGLAGAVCQSRGAGHQSAADADGRGAGRSDAARRGSL